jgi:hypothetical protein
VLLQSLRNNWPAGAAIAAVLLATAGGAPLAAADSSGSPFPGLERVDSKTVDQLHRRPDADLSAYSKVMIGEPKVEFSKSWNPKNYGRFGLSASQVGKIRTDMADLAKSTFAKVLGDGGYEVVTEASDGVLYITPNIVNLIINAPDTAGAGRSKTYVMDAGAMSLALQVNDAVTGTLLAVVYDHQRAGRSSTLQWVTSVSNRAAASAVLTGWAQQLKAELDASRAK